MKTNAPIVTVLYWNSHWEFARLRKTRVGYSQEAHPRWMSNGAAYRNRTDTWTLARLIENVRNAGLAAI